MGWLHRNIASLRKRFESAKAGGTEFDAFQQEVGIRISSLKREQEALRGLHQHAFQVMERLSSILHDLENINFDQGSFKDYPPKARESTLRKYAEALDRMERSIDEMQPYLRYLERAIELVKKEEQRVEK